MGLWLKNEDGFVPVSGGGGGSGGDLTWPLLAPDGTRFAPSYSFGTDGSSGLYLADDGSVRIAAEGSDAIGFDDRYITLGGQQQGVGRMSILAGSSGSPVYGFEGDIGTGIYRADAGVLGVSTGGVERLRVGSSSTFTGNLQVDGITTIHGNKVGVNLTALVSPPADHWTTYDGLWGSYGMHAGTQGGYMTSLTNNGYRVADAKWKSLGVNGQVGAAQVDLAPTGHFYVRVASNYPTGSAASPPARFTVTESGPTFRAMPSKTRTVDDILERAETAEYPPEDDEGVATMDDHDEVPLFEVVSALLAKVKELSAEIEELKAKDRPLKKQAAPRKKAATRKTTAKKEDS
jgi:hypothetical protein